MNEGVAAASDPLAHQAPSDTGLTAGAILRHAREKAGLHIGTLAVALKVPVKKLEALESDRLDQLPDAVFARALASSICRTLKLDPGSVLSLLPGQLAPRLQINARLSGASFDTPGMGWRLPLLTRLPRPVVVTASLLLVAALALLFVPSLERLKPASAKAPADAGGTAARNVPVANQVPSVPITAASPVVSAVAVAAAPASVAIAPTLATTGVEAGAGAPAKTVVDALPPEIGLVVFKTRGSSWVEVTDAGGVVQLRKIMANGETAGVSGALPLSVTVGRADSTEVLVRGKSFDLAPLAKDNIARFQIK